MLKRNTDIHLLSFLILVLAASAKTAPARTTGDSLTDYTWNTFRDTRIINGHSVETGEKGEGKFIISHRFGKVSGGLYELFGLDQSHIRIGLDYAVTPHFTVGAGRSSFQKTYDGYLKCRLLRQQQGQKHIPVSVTYFTGMALNTLRWKDPDRVNFFTSRLSFTHQLMLARKFSHYFSLQLSPTLVHRNLVRTMEEKNDVFALGVASRIQLTKITALLLEYYYVFPNQLQSMYRNSLSVGVEIETQGHVFQLHVSNSTGMIEPQYITQTVDDWREIGIKLGFNITRDFQLGARNFDR